MDDQDELNCRQSDQMLKNLPLFRRCIAIPIFFRFHTLQSFDSIFWMHRETD